MKQRNPHSHARAAGATRTRKHADKRLKSRLCQRKQKHKGKDQSAR